VSTGDCGRRDLVVMQATKARNANTIAPPTPIPKRNVAIVPVWVAVGKVIVGGAADRGGGGIKLAPRSDPWLGRIVISVGAGADVSEIEVAEGLIVSDSIHGAGVSIGAEIVGAGEHGDGVSVTEVGGCGAFVLRNRLRCGLGDCVYGRAVDGAGVLIVAAGSSSDRTGGQHVTSMNCA
jgi:hypothetical protein